LWSAGGTWERLLRQDQAEADAAGEIDWDIPVDSTIVRVHQHAADARTDHVRGGVTRSGRRRRRRGRSDMTRRPRDAVASLPNGDAPTGPIDQ
jgi:hypothetical protein